MHFILVLNVIAISNMYTINLVCHAEIKKKTNKTGKWEDLGFLLYLAQNPILRGFADNWEKKR